MCSCSQSHIRGAPKNLIILRNMNEDFHVTRRLKLVKQMSHNKCCLDLLRNLNSGQGKKEISAPSSEAE